MTKIENILDNDLFYISDRIKKWYENNKRDLPWRLTNNPYLIWLSEIILQQTRVDQGLPYYNRFTEKYSDVGDFAYAEEDDILKLWQGLGYYSRARNMHKAAKIIMDVYNGSFPATYDEILKLPGVGAYTAAAIASFAFNIPVAAIDGNVYRVLSRLFAVDAPINSGRGKKIFEKLGFSLLNKENPGLHNQAMMEFGALQCTPVSPDCLNCPLSQICLAAIRKEVLMYPVKKQKSPSQSRFFNYFFIRYKDYTYINKRCRNDIWKNLYEFPLIETSEEQTNITIEADFRKLVDGAGEIRIKEDDNLKHVLSHRIIYSKFFTLEIGNDTFIEKEYIKIPLDDLKEYAVSRLIHKYLEKKKII